MIKFSMGTEEGGPREYTQDQVNAILKRALERRGSSSSVTHQELIETARELGIEPSELEAAIVEQSELGAYEEVRAEWLKKRRQSFREHLQTFLIVNFGLFLIDIFVTEQGWFLFPFFGWGIGLMFDAAATFFPRERHIDRGARQLLAHRERKVRKEQKRSEKFSIEARGGKLVIEKGNKKIELG